MGVWWRREPISLTINWRQLFELNICLNFNSDTFFCSCRNLKYSSVFILWGYLSIIFNKASTLSLGHVCTIKSKKSFILSISFGQSNAFRNPLKKESIYVIRLFWRFAFLHWDAGHVCWSILEVIFIVCLIT